MLSDEQWIDVHSDLTAASRFLRLAAIRGDLTTVNRLLALGVDPNRFDETDARDLPDSNPGKTALHYAAGHGRSEVVEVLLQSGALPDAKRKHGDTPLMEWVRGRSGSDRKDPARNYHASAVFLLQAGADPQASMHTASGSAWAAATNKGILAALMSAYGEVLASHQAFTLLASTPTVEPRSDDIRRL